MSTVNQIIWGSQFAPSGAFTLEANTVFETKTKALAYVQGDATAVAGRVISVISDGDNNGVYFIESVGEGGTIKKVGSDIDLSNYVTKDQLTNIYTYQGTVDTYADLLNVANPQKGYVYNVVQEYQQMSTTDSTKVEKTYPAGTNWVYDGEKWDALGGSLDLSVYATTAQLTAAETRIEKTEVDIATINNTLTSKITRDDINTELTQIQTNKEAIVQLQAKDGDLETRLQSVETNVGSINLATLNSQVATNKQDIQSLKTRVDGHDTTLEQLRTDVDTNHTLAQANASTISTLSSNQQALITKVDNLESLRSTVVTLQGEVNTNTTSISNLNTDLVTHKANTDVHLTSIERDLWTNAANWVNNFLKDAAEDEGEGNTLVNVVDTLKEIQSYITSDGQAATALVNRVADLEAHKDDYIAADTTTLNTAKAYTDTRLAWKPI